LWHSPSPGVPTVCVSASGGGGGSGAGVEELVVAVGGVAAPSRERGRSPRPVEPRCCQGEQQRWGYFYLVGGSMDWFKGKSTGNHGFYHQI